MSHGWYFEQMISETFKLQSSNTFEKIQINSNLYIAKIWLSVLKDDQTSSKLKSKIYQEPALGPLIKVLEY